MSYAEMETTIAILRARISALEEERKNWIEQAEQGLMVEHDCPAMFACASIVADASDEEGLEHG